MPRDFLNKKKGGFEGLFIVFNVLKDVASKQSDLILGNKTYLGRHSGIDQTLVSISPDKRST